MDIEGALLNQMERLILLEERHDHSREQVDYLKKKIDEICPIIHKLGNSTVSQKSFLDVLERQEKIVGYLETLENKIDESQKDVTVLKNQNLVIAWLFERKKYIYWLAVAILVAAGGQGFIDLDLLWFKK
jgi:hypothetical protein